MEFYYTKDYEEVKPIKNVYDQNIKRKFVTKESYDRTYMHNLWT